MKWRVVEAPDEHESVKITLIGDPAGVSFMLVGGDVVYTPGALEVTRVRAIGTLLGAHFRELVGLTDSELAERVERSYGP